MLEYIEQAKKIAMRDKLDKKQCENLYRTLMFRGIEQDLQRNNYNDLLDGYVDYFSKKRIQHKKITSDMMFYRARVGNSVWKPTNEQDVMDYLIPYHHKEIVSAPHLMVSGGRFNREGVSYLYLASNLETCLAEIHLSVGQTCTIAQFQSEHEVKLMNLVKEPKDLEMKIWYEIMTQPVYEEIRYKYLITQFLADVFRKRFTSGIYFKSVQAKGENIVCFQPELFHLCQYTERIYKATSLNYQYRKVEDAADIFMKQEVLDTKQNLSSMNPSSDEKERLAYLEDLMWYRRTRQK